MSCFDRRLLMLLIMQDRVIDVDGSLPPAFRGDSRPDMMRLVLAIVLFTYAYLVHRSLVQITAVLCRFR
jgi:hypothetical protein